LMEMINDTSLEPTTKKISAQPTLIVRQSCEPLSVPKG